MLTEITQIKKWLAKKFHLKTEGDGMLMRIIDPVPEGEYTIPLGVSRTKTRVLIKDGSITIC